MEDKQALVEGVVERITFRNDASGYTVARLAADADPAQPGVGRAITIVGRFPSLSVGERLRAWGQWVNHPEFGRQLAVEDYSVAEPATVDGIRRYLGSGLIRGIGPATADRLVRQFGLDTLRVIAKEPERLQEVEGIGPQRARAIAEGYRRQKAIHQVMVFLQGHGISPALAARIYRAYGDEAIQRIRANPYRLAADIPGVGFKTADRIARTLGLSARAPQRLSAGVLHALEQVASRGHVYLLRDQLIRDAAQHLSVEPEDLNGTLERLSAENRVVVDEERVYLAGLYRAEAGLARALARLWAGEAARRLFSGQSDWEAVLARAERETGIALSSEQREAVRAGLRSGVLVLTGGPGTGKTTILRVLLTCLERAGLRVELASPTGRAAQRLREATGRQARTVHRLLEFGISPGEGFRFQRHEERPVDADAVIVDEASMVDLPLAYSLVRALAPGTRLVLVGDADQLPPVGPGYPLRDIIRSKVVPVVRLTRIYRQAEQSLIVTNAHRILKGEPLAFNRSGGDFFFIECDDPEQAAATVVELGSRRLPAYLGCDPVEDIQVLSPMRRFAAGADRLNSLLKAALNPRGLDAASGTAARLSPGDKVMQVRNNYDKSVFNGDIGRVVDVDPETGSVWVRFQQPDGPQEVEYAGDETDELALAYCITVHKSQGSEYPAVVIPLLTQHYMMLKRNLLYTAVTRARRMVVIVGSRRALELALAGAREETRASRLSERLREVSAG
ncbi:MAG: ATP-dependent RecD-like DNA helicase [Firmicutes bacterium]|nr:ATP-dependent RecD-like DNA helicase [Bacillota bacterium]